MPPAYPGLCHHPLWCLSPGGKEQDAVSRALSIAWKAVVPLDPTGPWGGSRTLAAEVMTEQRLPGLAVPEGCSL